jgi:hypothetical protein
MDGNAMTIEHGIAFVACLLVASGLLMRRSGRTSKRVRSQLPVANADAVVQKIHASESRLYDFQRDTDAMVETRLATLRGLTEEADRAAARLEAALNALAQRREIAILPFDEQSEAARLLKQAGYSDGQVAKLLDRGDETVRRAA